LPFCVTNFLTACVEGYNYDESLNLSLNFAESKNWESVFTYKTVWSRVPKILSLNAIWGNNANLSEFLSYLKPFIRGEKIGIDQEVFMFRGMVCFAKVHYVAYFHSQQNNNWYVLNDSNVTKKGWSEVLKSITSKGHFPVLLFYERLSEASLITENWEELSESEVVPDVGGMLGDHETKSSCFIF